jgi:hypothetical protein
VHVALNGMFAAIGQVLGRPYSLYSREMRAFHVGVWIAVPVLSAAALSDFRLIRVLELRSETDHVQGIDFDNRRLWVTSVNTQNRTGSLQEFSIASGERIRGIRLDLGERFHPGGISADRGSLWIPVAEYRRESSSVIQQRSKRTLEVEFQFDVTDHIGCVAATPDGLIGGNWDSRQFYIWDRRGHLLRKAVNPTGNAYQDLKFAGGRIVASGLLPDRSGAIDWLDYPSLRLVRRINAGNTDSGIPYTREGMAIRGGRLLLLPEDSRSRLFVFDLGR